jgi:hypothetical protein
MQAYLLISLVLMLTSLSLAQPQSMDEAFAPLGVYSGTTGARTTTMTGHVFCGYQGWFNTPDDGAGLGWRHWGKATFEPGTCNVDLWPDTSEMDADERVATPFRKPDGSVAHVYNANNPKTIARHFRWMRDYGIDGVFVQRFVTETRVPVVVHHQNTVLNAARRSANENGRAYAVMYDLSGLKKGETAALIEDWKRLVDRAQISRDERDGAYLRHNGKPVIAMWGIGFDDGRSYTLEECGKVIDFLKHDPVYGDNTVMIGVPTYWRTAGNDTVKDSQLREVIAKADIVSPWTVGRFSTPAYAGKYAREQVVADLAWCRDQGIEFLPVMFPGFSWHNMKPEAKSNDIPRRRGEFFWAQAVAHKNAGTTMAYVAMFDEVDEATAIYKLDPNPPTGASVFVNEKDVPADHYLWLTGQIARLFRGEIEPSDALPKRE